MRPRRNDPCPCGSGRKYKHCCFAESHAPAPQPSVSQASASHDGGVARAIDWLMTRHRKGVQVALDDLRDDLLEGEDSGKLGLLDNEAATSIQLNLTEWLLAEGDIRVRGEHRRVADLVLGAGGPLLSVGQRAWLEQLAQRPMRLYDVTDVVPGTGITLCDALDPLQAPIVVTERAGSRSMRPGMQIGARVMAVAGGHELSGAVYPFSMLSGRAMQDQLRAQWLLPYLPVVAAAFTFTLTYAVVQQH